MRALRLAPRGDQMKLSTLAIRLSTLAAMVGAAGACLAFYVPKIDIDRAPDSPTLTVRYSGAKVALIELKVNGRSVGSRDMTVQNASGETTFDLDAALLEDGDNAVEILLFDSAGKLLGSQKTTVVREADAEGPVAIAMPRPGSTVQGPVEIKVGVNQRLRGIYVSFFIDDEFKSLRNFPPYTYMWDTARVPNGWHDLEAWVVDEFNQTFRTRRVRVFVNNPGGRTEREAAKPAQPAPPVKPAETVKPAPPVKPAPTVKPIPPVKTQPAAPKPAPTPAQTAKEQLDLTLANNPLVPVVADSGAGLRSMMEIDGGAAVARPASPSTPADARTISPGAIRGATGPMAGVKPAALGAPVSAGPKLVAPIVAKAAPTPSISSVRGTTSQVELIRIGYGQRLTGVATFAVLLNGQMVDFDVAPSVRGGIPLTPFRHLLESAGGKVSWSHAAKTVTASAAGRGIWLKIGDRMARVGDLDLKLEIEPYIDSGRTIVPLSFIGDALKVNVDYDPATGHVLITPQK